MLLHQDFARLCNRGAFNSNFLSHCSDFAVSPQKEKHGTARAWHTGGNLPRKKGWPAVSALLPPQLYLPSLIAMVVGRKGQGWSGATAGLHHISSEDLQLLWLGQAAPASPGTSNPMWDFRWPNRRNSAWEVKDFPFWRHDGEAAWKLPCLWRIVCKCWEDEAASLPKLLTPWLSSSILASGKQLPCVCLHSGQEKKGNNN